MYYLCMIQLTASFSINMLLVSLTSLINKEAGSVSMLMVLISLPGLLFSAYIGAIIDHAAWKRKFIALLIPQSIFVLLAILFNYKSILLYFIAFLSYTIDIFIRTSLQVNTTKLADAKNYVKFNAVLNFMENIGVIAGPILAGILIEYKFYIAAFMLILFFIFTSGIFTLIYSRKQTDAILKSEEPSFSLTKNTVEWNSYITKLILIMGFFVFAIGIVNVKQILFVTLHFHTGDLGYSITESMWGAGMVLGCLILLLLEKKLKINTLVGSSFMLASISVLLLVLITSYPIALICYFLIGVTNIFISILSTTLIQKYSPVTSVGKNLGIKNICMQVFSIVGMTMTGMTENFINAEQFYLAASLILLMGCLVFYLFVSKQLRS